MRCTHCPALLLLFCVQSTCAQTSAVTLEMLSSDPATPTTLQRGESFYARVAYRSDRALRIRIVGLSQGNALPAMTNPAPRCQAPGGEALVWLAFDTLSKVDHVRISAEDEVTRQPLAQVVVPVALEWTGAALKPHRQVADWAQRMSREQQLRVSEELRTSSEAGGLAGTALPLVIALCLPGYLAVQIWSLKHLRGGWRTAAFVPMGLMCTALAVSLVALLVGSNLWPLWLILLSPVALLWLLAVVLVHRSGAAA